LNKLFGAIAYYKSEIDAIRERVDSNLDTTWLNSTSSNLQTLAVFFELHGEATELGEKSMSTYNEQLSALELMAHVVEEIEIKLDAYANYISTVSLDSATGEFYGNLDSAVAIAETAVLHPNHKQAADQLRRLSNFISDNSYLLKKESKVDHIDIRLFEKDSIDRFKDSAPASGLGAFGQPYVHNADADAVNSSQTIDKGSRLYHMENVGDQVYQDGAGNNKAGSFISRLGERKWALVSSATAATEGALAASNLMTFSRPCRVKIAVHQVPVDLGADGVDPAVGGNVNYCGDLTITLGDSKVVPTDTYTDKTQKFYMERYAAQDSKLQVAVAAATGDLIGGVAYIIEVEIMTSFDYTLPETDVRSLIASENDDFNLNHSSDNLNSSISLVAYMIKSDMKLDLFTTVQSELVNTIASYANITSETLASFSFWR
jgi:cob(I)alamin adenosyltransferase